MSPQTLFDLDFTHTEGRIELLNNISAIELTSRERDELRLGALGVLPKGASLELCGPGFNERTIKARCNGRIYFVFLRDLEPSEKALAAAN